LFNVGGFIDYDDDAAKEERLILKSHLEKLKI